MKEQDSIQAYVQLYLNDVELNISVTDKLKAHDGNLKNFGFFEISDGGIDTKPIFWDGIEWTIKVGKKEFKKEMKKQLDKRNYNWKEVYHDVKALLKKAKELNLITE